MSDWFDSLKEKVGAGVDTIKTGVGEAADKASDKMGDLKDDFVKAAEQWKDEKVNMLREFAEEKKNWIKNMLIAKLSLMFDHGFSVASEHLKEKAKDPYMPGCVQDIVDDIIDGMMPDLKGELKEKILTGFAPDMIIDHGDDSGCCGCFCAFFRYYLLPYDRSFWRQLRNPLFWLFTLASLVPKYGVGMITYMLFFLILDCKDEFQLQQYIISFKSLQFFNLGILSAVIGSVQYYLCVIPEEPNCQDNAPVEETWLLGVFILQVIFVWIAFCRLGSSERKGGYHYQMNASAKAAQREAALQGPKALEKLATEEKSVSAQILIEMQEENSKEVAERTHRRMMKFLIYDLIVFIVCLGLVCWAAFAPLLNGQEDSNLSFKERDTWTTENWRFVMTLFWIKALYGMLSFPFLALKLPVISQYFITHARPTGYNPYGHCVPYLGKEETKPVPWDPNRTSADGVTFTTEAAV